MPTVKTSTDKNKTTTTATTEKVSVPVSKAWLADFARKEELSALINEMTKEKKEVDARLKEGLGDADYGTFRGKVVVEQSFRRRKDYDRNLLETAFPEAAEACATETVYSVLRKK